MGKIKFFARLEAARPRILAGLYSLVARGLDPKNEPVGMRLPRMADFAKFAARAVGRRAVESKLAAVAHDNAAAALDGYPWVAPLVELMRHRLVPWAGTSAELLAELEAKFREEGHNRRGDLPKRWPGGAHVLSGQLDRVAPALRAVEGIEVEKVRNTVSRTLRITRRDAGDDSTDEASSEASSASPRASSGSTVSNATLLELLGFGQKGDASAPDDAPVTLEG